MASQTLSQSFLQIKYGGHDCVFLASCPRMQMFTCWTTAIMFLQRSLLIPKCLREDWCINHDRVLGHPPLGGNGPSPLQDRCLPARFTPPYSNHRIPKPDSQQALSGTGLCKEVCPLPASSSICCRVCWQTPCHSHTIHRSPVFPGQWQALLGEWHPGNVLWLLAPVNPNAELGGAGGRRGVQRWRACRRSSIYLHCRAHALPLSFTLFLLVLLSFTLQAKL